MPKTKHVPIRTCIACRTTSEKRTLMRVVRQPDGSVVHDPKGKLSGRGAYVCTSAECIARVRKQKKLERALKVSSLPEELFIELAARAGAGGMRSGTEVLIEPGEPAAARSQPK